MAREGSPEEGPLDLTLNDTKKPEDLREQHSHQREQPGCRELTMLGTTGLGRSLAPIVGAVGGPRKVSRGEGQGHKLLRKMTVAAE